MKKSTKISVIITTHNRSKWLDGCIQSVLSQNYKNYEAIIVDDGSIDDTKDVIRKYLNSVQYIYKNKSGIAAARNVGCRAAKGNYIAFVDDDDLMHPDRLTKLYGTMEQYPEAVCVFSQGTFFEKSGKELNEKVWINLPEENNPRFIYNAYEQQLKAAITITPLNTLIKKTAGEKIGWFDETFIHGCEDTDFFIRLSKVGGVVYVPEILTYVRKPGHKSIHRDRIRSAFSKLQLLEKHIKINQKLNQIENIKLLKNREYHFIKECIIINKDLDKNEFMHKINLNRLILKLPIKKMVYLFYLRFKVIPSKRKT